ncbi:hypothetical protein [Candidatus Clostridium radicumherbarum]|uniref:Uncharacterized protein n=1 Tax=Candidatus Clostridium radicumherbarum TaxID=3381662 RepID=A0ABW8TQ41_9CLOT
MKVMEFIVKMTSAYTDVQLVKSGWKVEEKDKLYTRIKGKYKFSYIIKSFGKIRISEMTAHYAAEDAVLELDNLIEFDFEEAWSILWNKSYEPQSLEILIKGNIFEKLIDKGWKPAVTGVIDYVQDDYDLSYYYPSPESENLYKIVDDNPGDVLLYVRKITAALS